MISIIRRQIEAATDKLAFFDSTHENVVASLADAYVQTVSTLTPRIMVSGEHNFLTQPENANRIRALLLAGMRAAILWRQSGGSRRQLLFRRKSILAETRRLLRELPAVEAVEPGDQAKKDVDG